MEVRRLIHRESSLLNIKNLWFRLLAETGIFGFSLFIGWMVSLVAVFLKKPTSDIPLEQVLGLMGLLTLAALVFEGFSIDSFAMPYWWISLGIASSVIHTREEKFNTKET
jgi:O-antigen ligase